MPDSRAIPPVNTQITAISSARLPLSVILSITTLGRKVVRTGSAALESMDMPHQHSRGKHYLAVLRIQYRTF